MNDRNENDYIDVEVQEKETLESKVKNTSLFNKVVIGLLALSLCSNGYLFYKMNNNTTTSNVGGSNTSSTVEQVNYDVKDDITEVVKTAQQSSVGVAVYQNGQYSGSGSGVIYKVDGKTCYVITNHHVISSASRVETVFANGQKIESEILGSDQYGDIAVLKCTVDFDVTAFDIGDSDLLDAGETVLVVGSPLSIENAGTVTKGIVSAPSRIVSTDLNNDGQTDWDIGVIVTDAAINAGNSGGALINAKGELVGITSMKLASTDVEGVCYAYPINDTLKLVNQIMSTGKVTRPVLGVNCVSLGDYNSYESYIYRYKTGVTSGVYIAGVQRGSAASNAGIAVGDVIKEFDGKEIETYKDFLVALYSKSVGDKVEIKVDRNGVSKTLTATLN